MKSNKLLLIITGLLIVLVVFIVFSKEDSQVTGSVEESSVESEAINATGEGLKMEEETPLEQPSLELDTLNDEQLTKTYGVDIDTPEETMRTLTVELQALRAESKQLKAENEVLHEQIDKVLNDVQHSIDVAVAEALNSNEGFTPDANTTSLLSQFEKRLLQFENAQGSVNGSGQAPAMSGRPSSAFSASGYDIGAANIPRGLGYKQNPSDAPLSDYDNDEIVWKNPIDATLNERDGKVSLPTFNHQENKANETLDKGGRKVNSVKAYTIPANAILMSSVSMTALLGRIPIDGKIPDPYPFKLIVGPENISSNGVSIPNIQGITMSGIAKGDWTLGCVSGEINSMTFTFHDGSIVTYPNSGNSANEPLAWFSDQYGVPCVVGKRVTNAPTYLSQRIGLGSIAAYANVSSQQNYTNTVTDGQVVSNLTGSASDAAKNQAAVGGVNQVTDWVEKRQQQSFDAIYVEPGTHVHIHIQKQIEIDYPMNDSGRKVQHEAYIKNQASLMSISELD